jgi:hypothetical protein
MWSAAPLVPTSAGRAYLQYSTWYHIPGAQYRRSPSSLPFFRVPVINCLSSHKDAALAFFTNSHTRLFPKQWQSNEPNCQLDKDCEPVDPLCYRFQTLLSVTFLFPRTRSTYTTSVNISSTSHKSHRHNFLWPENKWDRVLLQYLASAPFNWLTQIVYSLCFTTRSPVQNYRILT